LPAENCVWWRIWIDRYGLGLVVIGRSKSEIKIIKGKKIESKTELSKTKRDEPESSWKGTRYS